MTTFSIKVTALELDLLTKLASDQLFRMEFIDPKMPGHRSNASEVSLGKVLLDRLRVLRSRSARSTANVPGHSKTATVAQRIAR